MDSARFDSLTRTLAATGTRRRALAALAGSLALRGWHGGEDVDAHNPLKACKKKSGKQKKKCLKKAKAHNATHAVVAPPPPPTCAEQCPSTCNLCVYRKGGGAPFCSDEYGAHCEHTCTSDTDCVGKYGPYCITSTTDRETGTSYLACGSGGVCANISAC
jgi:hypothetical protein